VKVKGDEIWAAVAAEVTGELLLLCTVVDIFHKHDVIIIFANYLRSAVVKMT
jgi:hypothetical protein